MWAATLCPDYEIIGGDDVNGDEWRWQKGIMSQYVFQ